MHGLIKGVTQLADYETNQSIRKNAIELLNGIMNDINSGIGVWNKFLQQGSANAAPGAYGGWAGFSIEQDLFDLELEARDKAKQVSNGNSSLDEPIISLAYSKLAESQTPVDACNTAIDAMNDRLHQLTSLIELIKNSKPKKQGSNVSAKSSSTSIKKKSVKKQAAKKKTVKKKSTSAKPKAVKKKAAKKQAAKKKTSTKKKAAKTKTKKKSPSKKRK